MTEMHKLARPLLKGVKVQIVGSDPQYIDGTPIPNMMTRDILGGMPQFVGEIVVGNPIDPDCHEMTKLFLEEEALMCPFIFWVYDLRTTDPYPLKDRLRIAEAMFLSMRPMLQFVDHELLESEQDFTKYKEQVIDKDFFPGIVLREPYGTFGHEDEVIEAAATATVQ